MVIITEYETLRIVQDLIPGIIYSFQLLVSVPAVATSSLVSQRSGLNPPVLLTE